MSTRLFFFETGILRKDSRVYVFSPPLISNEGIGGLYEEVHKVSHKEKMNE